MCKAWITVTIQDPGTFYIIQEKADIVEYDKLYGLRAAARVFKVGFSTVQSWSKMDISAQRSKKGHLQHAGRPTS